MKELIQWRNNIVLIGTRIETRGKDEEFPVFLIDADSPYFANKKVGVAKKRVIGPVLEEKDDNNMDNGETE